MSELQPSNIAHTIKEHADVLDPIQSVPNASPPPEDIDLKLSRKREREVSIEPSTPQTQAIDIESESHEKKENRSPKKNRVHPDATPEEDDARSSSYSPPLSASPPHEVKVREISQGVEDIHWQNNTAASVALAMLQEHDDEDPTDDEDDYADDDDPYATETQLLEGQPSLYLRSTDTLQDRAESPPASFVATQSPSMDVHQGDSLTSVKIDGSADGLVPSPPIYQNSEYDATGQEKSMKRKPEEPADSQKPFGPLAPHATAGSEFLKRPRDDADEDANPRETKRPSPPPESQIEPPRPPSPAKATGGFMAYASTSSPFATVKGQSLFSGAKKSSIFGGASPKSTPAPSLSASFGHTTPLANTTPTDKDPVNAIASPLKRSGFEAFAGSTSPFASAITPTDTDKDSANASSSTPAKRTGFEAFAGSASPFSTTARSKSPSSALTSGPWNRNKSPARRPAANNTAFSSYASGTAHAFALPVMKRARAASPNGGSSRSSLERADTLGSIGNGDNGADDLDEEEEEESRESTFGEKLRATKDDPNNDRDDDSEPKIVLTEQEVETGEEEEETIRQVRGKLFALSPENQWKERGTGTLKLNVRISDAGGARLVMRKEAVYTVILNVTLFRGMRCFLSSDPRYIRFSVIEGGGTTHYNLRVATAKLAEQLLEDINNNIPL